MCWLVVSTPLKNMLVNARVDHHPTSKVEDFPHV